MLFIFANFIGENPHRLLAMILSLILGLTIGPIFVAANTMAHVVSDEEMRGKVFSTLEIVIHAAFLSTMFIASWASQYVGYVKILSVVGLGCLSVGVVGLIFAVSKKIQWT